MDQRNQSIGALRDLLRQRFSDLSARHKISSLGLFGSRVRGEERPESDLDVLVSFCETPTLLQLLALEHELSDLLGFPVDVALSDSLKPPVAERIAADLMPV